MFYTYLLCEYPYMRICIYVADPGSMVGLKPDAKLENTAVLSSKKAQDWVHSEWEKAQELKSGNEDSTNNRYRTIIIPYIIFNLT